VKKKRKAAALALVSIGGIMYATGNIQTLLKEESPFFNPYGRIEERAIIFLLLSLSGVMYAIWMWLKPTPQKIPFGRKFEEDIAAESDDSYYHVEDPNYERNFRTQHSTFPVSAVEKKSKKIPLLLSLYTIGYSALFLGYRLALINTAGFTLIDGAVILAMVGSVVAAAGFMFKQVYMAWSVGVAIALLQLIWFPYGTIAGVFLLSQLIPAKPPAISLTFKADRWRKRLPQKTLFHAKTSSSVFSSSSDKRDAA
jgi:hypothetical protein